ncbi:hypothetical protein BKA65DRAFT_553089 [Rhexocercosporidium sp. MPI-PUGE-AT-0058]|nr:hypothetical protein BKA65DRAFT_553089 [Rhexocercosporidium sp. MPI-PUGE-AT-0058]
MGGSSSKQTDSHKGKGRSSERSIQEVAEHRDRAIQSVVNLRAQFRSECSHPDCKETLPPLVYDKIFDAWLAGSQTIPPRSQFSTWSCKQGHSSCVGCGGTPKFNSENSFTSLGVVNHCCDGGRLFTIWFLLAQFDKLCLESEASSEKKDKAEAKTKPVPKPKAKASVHGVGYGADLSGMIPGDWSEDEIFMTHHMMFAGHPAGLPFGAEKDVDILDENASQDQLLADTVKILGACLPSTDSDTTIELDMFRLGMLFDKIIQLIRNDSIVDITERLEVYQAIAGFIIKIANHPGLVQLLLDERPNKANTPGLGELSLASYFTLRGLDDTSRSKPLIACYSDTFLQTKTFLDMSQNPKSTIKASTTWHSKESNKLLQELVTCFETLDAVASSNIAPVTDTQPEDSWTKFADDNKVTFTDEVLLHHRYTDHFKALQTSNRGRLTTISKEIATLKTSLPTGIFLKVAESRSDVMKVLIIGSEGSPYAGGLFIFDIFLDERYPATPPKMTFTLHGNDEDGESFNPNLHIHSGTVCLSLLNTWPGDPSQAWQPYKSTILSVLVSIQAMILGAPMPWENEPGFEGSGATARNLTHKARVESRTLRFAIIAWLENKFTDPLAKEHIWKDISQTYWKHNGLKVLEYVREWVSENPGLLNFGPTDYWLRHIKGINPRQAPGVATNNLAEKLSTLLGVPYDAAAFPTVNIRVRESRSKRKSSTSKNPTGSSKKLKGPVTTSSHQFKWVYTSDKSQKMVRKACKDFGIGYANTIKASIEKLEAHVNGDLDVDEELVEAWGEMVLNPSQSPPSQQHLEDEYFESMNWQKEMKNMADGSQMTSGTFTQLPIPTMTHPQVSLFGPSNLAGSVAQTYTVYSTPSFPALPHHQTMNPFHPSIGSSSNGSNTTQSSGKKSEDEKGPATPPVATLNTPKFPFKSGKQPVSQSKGKGASTGYAIAIDHFGE